MTMQSFITRFIFALLVTSWVSPHSFSGIFTSAQTFANRWSIQGQPESRIEDNTYYITFDVHESITADNIIGEFRELTCDEDGRFLNETDGFLGWGSEITAPGKGSLYFNYDIVAMKNNTNIFKMDQLGLKAGFHLCAKYIFVTMISGNETEVARREMDLVISLELGVGIELNFENPDPDGNGGIIGARPPRSQHEYEDSWDIDAYICDPSFPMIPLYDMIFNQGSLVSVCITPSPAAVSKGLVLESVDSFTWSRGDVTQLAVQNHQQASNFLTYFECHETMVYCTISSILFADFFLRSLDGVGMAVGYGTSTLKFLGSPGRQLEADERALQSSPEGETVEMKLAINIKLADDSLSLLQEDEVSAGGITSMGGGMLLFALGFLVNAATILL